ncbi:MAG: FlgD immunoglobulin-like domain containing protein [bacterium]
MSDVGIAGVAPTGTIDTLTTVTPQVRVFNYGGESFSLTLRMAIRVSDDSLVYADSVRFTLPGGGNTVVSLRPFRFQTLGEHVSCCSLFVQDDTILLGVVHWTFLVVPEVGLAGEQTLPAGYELRADFAGRQVSFAVPVAGPVELAVLASDGRLVRHLRDGPCAAGRYALAWDGSDAAGRQVGRGIYYVRLTAPGFTGVQKLVRVQ